MYPRGVNSFFVSLFRVPFNLRSLRLEVPLLEHRRSRYHRFWVHSCSWASCQLPWGTCSSGHSKTWQGKPVELKPCERKNNSLCHRLSGSHPNSERRGLRFSERKRGCAHYITLLWKMRAWATALAHSIPTWSALTAAPHSSRLKLAMFLSPPFSFILVVSVLPELDHTIARESGLAIFFD